jgi:hypothetical protein
MPKKSPFLFRKIPFHFPYFHSISGFPLKSLKISAPFSSLCTSIWVIERSPEDEYSTLHVFPRYSNADHLRGRRGGFARLDIRLLPRWWVEVGTFDLRLVGFLNLGFCQPTAKLW